VKAMAALIRQDLPENFNGYMLERSVATSSLTQRMEGTIVTETICVRVKRRAIWLYFSHSAF